MKLNLIRKSNLRVILYVLSPLLALIFVISFDIDSSSSYGQLETNSNGSGSSDLIDRWQNYRSEFLGISFSYPVGWELKEGNDEIKPGPDVSVSDGKLEFRVNDFAGNLITKSWSLEELVKNAEDSYKEILSRKIVQKPSLEKYVVGGEMTASLASERENDNGKLLVDLEIYADHGDRRYLFDFNSPKDVFSTEETEQIRQKIINSIVFLE